GVAGDAILSIPALFTGDYPSGIVATVVAVVLAAPGLWLFLYASGLIARSSPLLPAHHAADDDAEDDYTERRGSLFLGALTHMWLSLRGSIKRTLGGTRPTVGRTMRLPPLEEDEDIPEWPEPEARAKPVPRAADHPMSARQEPRFAEESDEQDDD